MFHYENMKAKQVKTVKNLVKTKKKSTDSKIKKLKNVLPKRKKVNNVEATKGETKTKVAKSGIGKKVPGQKAKKSKILDKQQLEGLKDLDPEFYDFLKKNDKELLEFDLLDSDDDDDDNDIESKPAKKKKRNSDNDEDDEDDEKYHKPSDNLMVASDESDFEDEEELEEHEADGSQKVTLNLLRNWQLQLEQQSVSIDVVRKVIKAFNSALASISADAEEQLATTAYKVVGAAAFNGVIQLCVLHLQPAILRLLGIKPGSNMPLHKTKKWVKVRGCLRYYLTDLIRLVEQISSTNILGVLLKHLHQMAGMVSSFSTLGKTILKRLIVLWSTGDETVRVLSFLCILKITRLQQTTMLNHVLKAMYLSYVRNSKFVSPNSLPGINFMRRSLVEMFALDLNVTYQHAFLYIRQLAIHLRNAVILKKKDSFQAVYNWQFVNSLRLWSDLLGATTQKPQLQPLVYPLVTITTGVIRLIPTAQYFPLRFHCLQALISLAKETNVFVPILPLILEVLRSNTFNRKHTTVSMRPVQFTCILRLNKAQLGENGFRDEVIEQVSGLTLEYLAHESSSLGFADLVVPTVIALKAYLKICRNANYTRKLKQLLEKIQENARFIEQERKGISFGLQDVAAIRAWETRVRNKRTPLDIYYTSWVKTHETKKRRQAAQTDSINDGYDVPTVKRPKKGVAVKNEDGEVELFPSDSEDDNHGLPVASDEEVQQPTLPQKKAKKIKIKSVIEKPSAETEIPEIDADEADAGNVDIVKDLDLNDW